MIVCVFYDAQPYYLGLREVTLAELRACCRRRIRKFDFDHNQVSFRVRDLENQWLVLDTDATFATVLRTMKNPVIGIATTMKEAPPSAIPLVQPAAEPAGRQKMTKFGVSESDWAQVSAEEMRMRFSNTRGHYCSQWEWLDEYWLKLGLKTDTEKAWNVPSESDEMAWDLETWGTFIR